MSTHSKSVMANSKVPGPIGLHRNSPLVRTPGPLGLNDHADPTQCSVFGDSPGILGVSDYADPTLPVFGDDLNFSMDWLGRTYSGLALRLPSSGIVPAQALKPVGAITANQLQKIFSAASSEFMEQVASELSTNPAKYGLDTALRRAHFFAQVRQEGGAAMEAKVESLNYSPEGLKTTFKYYRLHPAEALSDGYTRDGKTHKISKHADEQSIGNKAYADRNGNGHALTGDGWNYRGRGLIQITGRSNYAAATLQYKSLYSDQNISFEASPDLMGDFPYTVRSAVCFWMQHQLHKLADRGAKVSDVDRITKIVNLHTGSYGDRRANFKVAYRAFK